MRVEPPARRAGISGPKRRGSPFTSTHSFPRYSGWPTNLPSLGLHFTWPGAARGFADYPPSAGLTALPTMFRALGALTFWQVATERTLGANSRSGSFGPARYRPSGPVLSVPADQKFPDHEISVWTDKAPDCYFEISRYNRAKGSSASSVSCKPLRVAWFPKFVAAENSSALQSQQLLDFTPAPPILYEDGGLGLGYHDRSRWAWSRPITSHTACSVAARWGGRDHGWQYLTTVIRGCT